MDTKKKSKKGFASMTIEKRKAIASLGGKNAWKNGKAHSWTSEEARRMGLIGGKISAAKRRKPHVAAG